MWAYNFARKESREQVPRLETFLKMNHDLPKLWYYLLSHRHLYLLLL